MAEKVRRKLIINDDSLYEFIASPSKRQRKVEEKERSERSVATDKKRVVLTETRTDTTETKTETEFEGVCAKVKRKGRPRISDSEQKRRRTARKQSENKTRVTLGREIARWMEVKSKNDLKTDREVATFLIDSYDGRTLPKIETSASTESHTHRHGVEKDFSTANMSPVEYDRNKSLHIEEPGDYDWKKESGLLETYPEKTAVMRRNKKLVSTQYHGCTVRGLPVLKVFKAPYCLPGQLPNRDQMGEFLLLPHRTQRELAIINADIQSDSEGVRQTENVGIRQTENDGAKQTENAGSRQIDSTAHAATISSNLIPSVVPTIISNHKPTVGLEIVDGFVCNDGYTLRIKTEPEADGVAQAGQRGSTKIDDYNDGYVINSLTGTVERDDQTGDSSTDSAISDEETDNLIKTEEEIRSCTVEGDGEIENDIPVPVIKVEVIGKESSAESADKTENTLIKTEDEIDINAIESDDNQAEDNSNESEESNEEYDMFSKFLTNKARVKYFDDENVRETVDKEDNQRRSGRIRSKGFRPDYAAIELESDKEMDTNSEENEEDKENPESDMVVKIDREWDTEDEAEMQKQAPRDKRKGSNEDGEYEEEDISDEISSDSDSDWCSEDEEVEKTKTAQMGRRKGKDKIDESSEGSTTRLKKVKNKNSKGRKKHKKRRAEWVTIKLEDHEDKYAIETFTSYEQKHRKNCVSEKLYSCLVCNQYKVEMRETLEQHIEKHVNGAFKCPKCQFDALTFQALFKHKKDCVEVEKRVCDICGYVTHTLEGFWNHKGEVHNVTHWKCRVCHNTFTTMSVRKKHMIEKHGEQLKYCAACKKFKTSLTLEQYQEHLSACRKEIACEQCGLMITKAGISSHINRHHLNVRRHKCNQCPYIAKTAKSLQLHLRVHEGVSDVIEDSESDTGSEVFPGLCIRSRAVPSDAENVSLDDDWKDPDYKLSDAESSVCQDESDHDVVKVTEKKAVESLQVNLVTSSSRQKSQVTVEKRASVLAKGQRDWKRKHVCFICMVKVCDIPRHLSRKHIDNELVKEALSKPIGSKERRTMWRVLVNRGAFSHNVKSRDIGGELLVVRRSSAKRELEDYVACLHCYGYYLRKDMWKHAKNCSASVFGNKDKNSIQKSVSSISAIMTSSSSVTSTSNKLLQGFISKLKLKDSIYIIVKNDSLLNRYTVSLLEEGKSHTDVSYTVRLLAKLLVKVREMAGKDMQWMEALDNKLWNIIAEAVQIFAEFHYTEDGVEVDRPNIALKCGQAMKGLIAALEGYGLSIDDETLMSRASKMLVVFDREWPKIAKHCHVANRNKSEDDPNLMPFTSDVVKLKEHCVVQIARTSVEQNDSLSLVDGAADMDDVEVYIDSDPVATQSGTESLLSGSADIGHGGEESDTSTRVHPYKCDQCTFTCVQRYQLTSHLRTHTGEKPYKCDMCNYAAAWNVQLKDHKKAHFSTMAITCQHCGIVFKNAKTLKLHAKKIHSS